MNCENCGLSERENKDQYNEYFCNCEHPLIMDSEQGCTHTFNSKYAKDRFQTMPRTGNQSNPEMEQGCNHYLRGHQSSAQSHNQIVGMLRRADGKVYCNACHTLDNFREVFLLAYRKNNFDELEVQNIHGKVEAAKEEILTLACNCCGNVQIKV